MGVVILRLAIVIFCLTATTQVEAVNFCQRTATYLKATMERVAEELEVVTIRRDGTRQRLSFSEWRSTKTGRSFALLALGILMTGRTFYPTDPTVIAMNPQSLEASTYLQSLHEGNIAVFRDANGEIFFQIRLDEANEETERPLEVSGPPLVTEIRFAKEISARPPIELHD